MTYTEFNKFNNALTESQRRWLMNQAQSAGVTMIEYAGTNPQIPDHDNLDYNGHVKLGGEPTGPTPVFKKWVGPAF